jgi:bifunctional non-homologous end joining protein LigD
MSCGVREPIPEHLRQAADDATIADSIFCLQKHHASSLHWDLRLQQGETMPSWAVPKCIPESKEDGNRLGIKVEDHDLDYADFHGHIPEGQYGSGQVELIDIGPMEVIKWEDRYIKVRLNGQHYKGVWSLRNTKGKNWIIRVSSE